MATEQVLKTNSSIITFFPRMTELAVAIPAAATMLRLAHGKAIAKPHYAQQASLPCSQCRQGGGGKFKPVGKRIPANENLFQRAQ